jgi:hypothetical protein
VDTTAWNSGLDWRITPPAGYFGSFNLTYTVTARERANNVTATVVKVNTVNVLVPPVAVGQSITAQEDVGYVLHWSDFAVTDLDSPNVGIRFADSPTSGYLQVFNGSSWVDFEMRTYSRAEIDAGTLRFLSCENESGYSGYSEPGFGNKLSRYATLSYYATDGQLDSNVTTMTINVTPVADELDMKLRYAGDGFPIELFDTHFEDVANPDLNATLVNAATLEGWTLITSPDRNAGGTNVFEVWSHNDLQANANGVLKPLNRDTSEPGNNFLELNDAAGTEAQTLGIQRTINTIAGAVYTLWFDAAAPMGYSFDYTGIEMLVDGQRVDSYSDTSSGSTLAWHAISLEFIGTGGPQTIQIRTSTKFFVASGRGMFIDNLCLNEQIPNTGWDNSAIGLQLIQTLLADDDGSETYQVFLDDIPVGATLADQQGHSFTATAGNTTADVSGWSGYGVYITPPQDFEGDFTMTARGVSTEQANGDQAIRELPVTVHVLHANRAPQAVDSTIMGAEDTPYVFTWADFHITDVDSPDVSLYLLSQPYYADIEYFNGTAWVYAAIETNYSRADIDAGRLRLVPDANQSAYSGYAGDWYGNQGRHLAKFQYVGCDGPLDSAITIMTIDVTPVADTPTLTLTETGTVVPTQIFTTGWETVTNPNANVSIVNQSTLEGWTLVTSPEGQAGGTNVFEIWGHNDNQTNASGTTKQIKRATNGGNSWIELNDASGSNNQTLGIQRTVTTAAGANYHLSAQYAAEMGFAAGYGVLSIYIDGVLVDTWGATSGANALNWTDQWTDFIGAGGSQTIKIVTTPSLFNATGRGAMLDNITLTEGFNNTGYKNSPVNLQTVNVTSVDQDGSEDFGLTVSNIPVGYTLADGIRTFTASAGNTSVDATDWDWGHLSILPVANFFGSFDLTLTARSFEIASGASVNGPPTTLHVTVVNMLCPIVLDLDGNGIQTVALAESNATFDLANDGNPVRSGWISPGDGFLAVDTNRNGHIDDRSELFGGETGEGFAKLAAFDSNHDGKVDKKDKRFKELRVWQDRNGNHVTDAGELTTLKEAGVKSLNTAYSVNEETQNGNRFIERGTAVRSNGKTIEMSDVYFPTAPAALGLGASFGPGWQEPGDKTARIIVESMLRGAEETTARSQSVLDRMLNSFAPASVDKQLPASPTPKSAQKASGAGTLEDAHSSPKPDPHDAKHRDEVAHSSPKPDPRTLPLDPIIEWRAKQHTDAIPYGEVGDTPTREAEWLGDILGVRRVKKPDLGKLTGLKIRLPGH